ncbi:primosomal protein N' [Brachyspira pilosicoli]|uniref:Replication restart protein PriA n=1 Tax=Brachyspira pilosicoli TaxID=52584 RepID=A0AAJ6KDQ6_BRAPL|nr:primosomal protein N' [Brachyspira pilosicoli]WIH90146.1 primosomal protein N' [Brachyspira pilosicoli]WIH92437.1 primosomal protein N' [Brachyspira pilosicoli]WIH94729.1 primosomal protein N' [Brachyspira pilosicoli]
MYVKVVFNLPIDKVLTYKKPDDINDSLIGCRVIAPIRNRGTKGIVIEETDSLDGDYKVLPITTRIDLEPICSENEFNLAKWMSRYYHSSYGEALFAALPAGNPSKKKTTPKPIKVKQKPYLNLNDEQESVLNTILKSIEEEKKSKSFLLHGVTGSGKTEVYLQAIKRVVDLGKQAIVILPEISLTPQTIKRFAERFEGKIAVLHSKLSPTAKYRYWQMIRNNEIKIVIGARSAIFSPTPNLGIIVIDEEHETSYKSNETPRYHARQIAFYRKERENATLILGSATPSLESYYHALNGTIELLTLTKRAASINMPEVKILDLKKEKRADSFPMLTQTLVEEINKKLELKEQIILFLNRKGYAPVVSCSHCGVVLECPNCSVSLTYHKKKNVVMCHYCGYTQFVEELCDKCNIGHFERIGTGTEKVEENLNTLFPNAVIERMDQETVGGTKKYEDIFKRFVDREIDILIGTQMIAKGLDFPNVTLVGVLLADMSLHIPDFRSAERTFNLITQVAGRSGRGDKKGVVYIQAFNTNHYAVLYAKEHDYISFYNREIENRKHTAGLPYPPFLRLVRIVVRGIDAKKVESDANIIADLSRTLTYQYTEKVEVLGAVPCTMSKLNKYYRWNILIKTASHSLLKEFFESLNKSFIAQKGNYIEIDIDPVNML